MKLKCLICNEVIESKYTHDFVSCKCGGCFVDGGKEYFRCGGKDFSKMLVIYDDGTEKLLKEEMDNGE